MIISSLSSGWDDSELLEGWPGVSGHRSFQARKEVTSSKIEFPEE